MSIFDGFYSLGANINKVKGKDTSDDTHVGVMGDLLPELSLSMSNEDLIDLTEKWEKKWSESTIRANWIKQVEDNENYWRGKQYNKLETEQLRPLVDNIVFQSVETWLPAATRQNPEPMVDLRSTEPENDQSLKYAQLIRNRLADWSDDVKLRLKIKKAGRNWVLSLIGVAKLGWDMANDRPACKIVRPRKLILNPDGVTDEDGYSGKYVGEYRKLEASEIIKIVEKQGEKDAAEYIKSEVKQDLGTDFQFIEWWTDDYMCWVAGKHVLMKRKNPHYNWGDEGENELSPIQPEDIQTESETIGETGGNRPPIPDSNDNPDRMETPTTGAGQMNSNVDLGEGHADYDEESDEETQAQPTGPNHFKHARMPYIFIAIFGLGKSPVDETSLITQILPQQDKINKREKQIDKNADGMNGGVVVSEERSGLTKEEAREVTDAVRRGGTVIVPTGAPGDAILRLPSVGLPTDVFNDLGTTINRVYDLFGIKGITPAGIQNEDTVRGKIITKGLDTDRIGGGITEYFEQFADDIYNYVVQLFYVYDDIFANNPGAKPPKLKISVKEGSLLPKDATTKANQAVELAGQGKMSLVDLYKALEYSNPEEMAMNVWLEANAPELLFKDDPRMPEAMQIIGQKQKAAQDAMMAQEQAKAQAKQSPQKAAEGPKGPSESISFKDLPPTGKMQMAAQAGLHISAEEAQAHEEANKPPVKPGSSLPAKASTK